MTHSRKKILTFLLLTFAFSSVFYLLIARLGRDNPLSLGLMWSPGLAGLLTQLAFERSLRGMGWKPGKVKYLLLAYALPLGYGLVAYLLAWITGLGRFSLADFASVSAKMVGRPVDSPLVFSLVSFFILATAGVIISSLSALGEEIGWRGLLVPELARELPFSAVALVSGLVWALWHYPIILFGGYNNPGLPIGVALVCFTLLVLAISFAFAWLRLKSGSLWVAVLLHASHNLFIQNVFDPLTQNTGATMYWTGEFGILLALTGTVVAFLFWRRRARLPSNSPAAN